jgi:hypothetical protein
MGLENLRFSQVADQAVAVQVEQGTMDLSLLQYLEQPTQAAAVAVQDGHS